MISTVFLGTPAAAIPSLQAVAALTEVRLVITRPDRARGRSRRVRPSSIKEAALELALPVATPSTTAELEEGLQQAQPLDIGVVVAFGMLLPPRVLEIPRRGFVNVHFSVLPRWRGAAPVERAILAGDETSGVSLMVMDEGLDTGPVIAVEEVAVPPEDDAGRLTDRLAERGAGLVAGNLIDYVEGRIAPAAQVETDATYAPRLEKEELIVRADWESARILRTVRALSPHRGARFEEGILKVWKAARTGRSPLPAGRLELEGSQLYLGTADHPIELVEVQAPGTKRMSGAAWARGRQGELGRLR